VASAAYFADVHLRRRAGDRAGSLADRVCEGLEVVNPGYGPLGVDIEAENFPSARRGEAVSVDLAQVVGVRFGVRCERADDRGGVRIDVRERCDRRAGTRDPRAAAQRAHERDRTRPNPSAAITTPSNPARVADLIRC
jgi:hypothetical protein